MAEAVFLASLVVVVGWRTHFWVSVCIDADDIFYAVSELQHDTA